MVLTAALFVAYVFRRYGLITGDSSSITAVEEEKWGQCGLIVIFFVCIYESIDSIAYSGGLYWDQKDER